MNDAADEKVVPMVVYTATVTLSRFEHENTKYAPVKKIEDMARRFNVTCNIEGAGSRYGEGERYKITFSPVKENAYFLYAMVSLLNSLRGNGYLDQKDFYKSS
jgi:hypothetical protein